MILSQQSNLFALGAAHVLWVRHCDSKGYRPEFHLLPWLFGSFWLLNKASLPMKQAKLLLSRQLLFAVS